MEHREMKRAVAWVVLAIWMCMTAGCRHGAPAKTGWIHGDSDQRWTIMERQLRGLDIAMVEIGYRYQELYWAGMDSNWEYADYQLIKMALSLENALERRPKRRSSAAELFLLGLGETKRAVASRQHAGFKEAFVGLTAACNSCHVAEGVANFYVDRPESRPSPIRAPR
jgi:hypothetical protein